MPATVVSGAFCLVSCLLDALIAIEDFCPLKLKEIRSLIFYYIMSSYLDLKTRTTTITIITTTMTAASKVPITAPAIAPELTNEERNLNKKHTF